MKNTSFKSKLPPNAQALPKDIGRRESCAPRVKFVYHVFPSIPWYLERISRESGLQSSENTKTSHL